MIWLDTLTSILCYKLDRKSTCGKCHLLGNSLVSWKSKKHASVTVSLAKAECIVADSCCTKLIWMKQRRNDYDVNIGNVPIRCDNTSAINLIKI